MFFRYKPAPLNPGNISGHGRQPPAPRAAASDERRQAQFWGARHAFRIYSLILHITDTNKMYIIYMRFGVTTSDKVALVKRVLPPFILFPAFL